MSELPQWAINMRDSVAAMRKATIDMARDPNCPVCDVDMHRCPGCGDVLPHGEYVCGICYEPKLYDDPYPGGW